MTFAFPERTVAFLAELRENNTREWFEAHRDEYHSAYLEPAREFVTTVGPSLSEMAPGIVADPRINGSILRINRDLRFSRDKRPYKDHLDIGFWHNERRSAPSAFLFRVTPEVVAVGAGAVHFTREAAARFRPVADHPELAAVRDAVEAAGVPVSGERGGLVAIASEPPTLASDSALVERCLEIWEAVAPLHRWLVENVG